MRLRGKVVVATEVDEEGVGADEVGARRGAVARGEGSSPEALWV